MNGKLKKVQVPFVRKNNVPSGAPAATRAAQTRSCRHLDGVASHPRAVATAADRRPARRRVGVAAAMPLDDAQRRAGFSS